MRRGREKEGTAGAAARSKRKMERGRGQRGGGRARRERGLGPRRRPPGPRGPPRGWRGQGVGAWAGRAGSGPGPAARGPRCAGAPGGVGRGRSQAGPRPPAGGPGGGERVAPRGWPRPSPAARPRAPPPPDRPSVARRPSVVRSFSPVSAPLAAQASHRVALRVREGPGRGARLLARTIRVPRAGAGRGSLPPSVAGVCAFRRPSRGHCPKAAEQSAAMPLPVEAVAAAAAAAEDAHWRSERSPRRRGRAHVARRARRLQHPRPSADRVHPGEGHRAGVATAPATRDSKPTALQRPQLCEPPLLAAGRQLRQSGALGSPREVQPSLGGGFNRRTVPPVN